jgi:hypothetical protein
MSLEGPTSRSVTDTSSNNARNTGAQSVNLMTNACLPLQSGWHLASARVILGILGLGLDLLVARATTAPARLTSRWYTTQMDRPAMPSWVRKNGWMVCTCRRLVYGSPAVPAPQHCGVENWKKEDDAGECVIGEIESDGSSKC